MRRGVLVLAMFGLILIGSGVNAQRVVAECAVDYRVQPDSGWNERGTETAVFSGNKKVFIKGNDLRVDMESPGFLQSFIYDKSNLLAVVLREIGTNKFITRLAGNDWQQELKKYDSIQVTFLNAFKTIIGYDCKSLQMKLKDGSEYLVYYTTTIAPSVREFELAFKDVPGFVLQYTVRQNKHTVTYTASRISFSPVPASRFDIPTSGYRILEK